MASNSTSRSAVEALVEAHSSEASLVAISGACKIGIKGPGAIAWLGDHKAPCPTDIYGTVRVDDGSLVVRIASDEVIVESSDSGGMVQRIDRELGEHTDGVYRVEQQSETLLLSGSRAGRVWAEACGVNVVRASVDRIIYTRVAGISCGIIPEGEDDQRSYRIWVDYSYAPGFYRTVMEILGQVSED